MTVIETRTGFVAVEDGYVIRGGPFATHAAAWRWIDRAENEPISRAEDVADWIARKETRA
jgi:hypothetical protein